MLLPSPRYLAALGLLAVVPVAVYFLDNGDPATGVATGLAAVSVLLIVASLAVMLSPADATEEPATL